MRVFPLVLIALFAQCYHTALTRDIPQKPGVLCLGDSIRLGWSKYLEIPGHEIVSPPDNGRRLANGLKRFPTWAGKRQWHIILAGFGLHDLKHRVVNDTATGR